MTLRAEAASRFDLITYAFCLMGNHYHLVVESALSHVSLAVHRLNGLYAQAFNRRHTRTGHLYEQRPAVRAVDDDAYLERACEYVRANPVRAGLCLDPADWRWSGSDFDGAYPGTAARCTGASAGAHEHSGDTSPARPFSSR